MTRPKGEMSDDLFYKIVEEGKKIRHSYFVPFLNGEPFIFSRIYRWLDYLQERRARTHIFTNAEFVDVDRVTGYNNISVLCVSLNAATKETYDKVVRGPRFETVVKNTERMIEKAQCPMYVSMVVVEQNKHEVDLFREKWGRHAIFGEFKNWGGKIHDPEERDGERVPCWTVLHTLNILWDGRVVPCCLDYDGEVITGDVNEQSLLEVWDGMQPLRRKHQAGDFNVPLCRDCNQNIT